MSSQKRRSVKVTETAYFRSEIQKFISLKRLVFWKRYLAASPQIGESVSELPGIRCLEIPENVKIYYAISSNYRHILLIAAAKSDESLKPDGAIKDMVLALVKMLTFNVNLN